MADPKSPKAPENDALKAAAPEPAPEPRNLTREMLAAELGEEEARRRIP